MRLFIIMCAVVGFAGTAQARPVTYRGGSMGMIELDGRTIMVQVEHTMRRNLAVGTYVLSERDGDRRSSGMVLNYLAMRRNTADSQANAYLSIGAGPSTSRQADGRRGSAEASGWVAGEADWETRRLFVGGMAKVSLVGDRTEAGYRLRAGVAPYVANTGALHTWLFAQLGRAAEPGAKTELTPVVRLFKGPFLAEAGVSTRGRGFGTFWFYF